MSYRCVCVEYWTCDTCEQKEETTGKHDSGDPVWPQGWMDEAGKRYNIEKREFCSGDCRIKYRDAATIANTEAERIREKVLQRELRTPTN